MTPSNCLAYALDRWSTDGGYLMLRRSLHWGMPHVLHQDTAGRVTHFRPPETLAKPTISLSGYPGIVVEGDDVEAPPMPLTGIVVGAWIAALGATWWAVVRWMRRL